MTTPDAPDKTETRSFRMEPDTLTNLKAIAEEDEATLSSTVRELINKEARRRAMIRQAEERLRSRPVDFTEYGPQPVTMASGAATVKLTGSEGQLIVPGRTWRDRLLRRNS